MAPNAPLSKKRPPSSPLSVNSGCESVSFDDFKILLAHVNKLTNVINEIRLAIIENGSPKLALKVTETCEPLKELPTFATPILVAPPILAMDATPLSPTATPSSQPLSYASVAAASNRPTTLDPITIAKQAVSLMEKSTRAVLERMPDSKTADQDSIDLQFCQSLAADNSLPVPQKVHRHPCTSRYRPLKLQFNSKTERDSFIVGFNRVRRSDPNITSIDSLPRIRRDLTPPELQTLRASRKYVYDENKKAGQTILIMSDILYKSNPKPRPFV